MVDGWYGSDVVCRWGVFVVCGEGWDVCVGDEVDVWVVCRGLLIRLGFDLMVDDLRVFFGIVFVVMVGVLCLFVDVMFMCVCVVRVGV